MIPYPCAMRAMNLFALLASPVLAGTLGPLSIDQSDIYKGQRQCVFSCYEYSSIDIVGGPIAEELSCAYRPVQNDCFCRPDLQREAVSYISSCVGRYCSSNPLDISTATNIYKDYCTSNGYLQAQATTEASITGALTVTVTEAVATRTVTVLSNARGGPSSACSLSWSLLVILVTITVGVTGGVASITGFR
ncbi:hypothetical protein BKA67DRAFT_533016 [Truncatella angustata]|uniref:Extracellular membrane protein CFEM domain-containing protein n=1 Tax=Truncatella angustata TaxID=152316 RepID=A0A9P9A011_9PEZI|nr:uncharacterized protein BKA67DRAFT_533016 [Truncatella angustata]KAH6657827.1 hypothetical protein BKA67DRAFT_533016 [Truncatella angustata]